MFKDTRLSVATVFENLEDMSIEEVMDEYDVTREQIEAVLEFVAQSLKTQLFNNRCRLIMRILLDHGTPRGLARAVPEHTVTKTKTMHWERLSNGALLKAAEEAGFAWLLSTDNNIRYQQNLTERRIAIIILTGCTKWSRVSLHFERIAVAVNAVTMRKCSFPSL